MKARYGACVTEEVSRQGPHGIYRLPSLLENDAAAA